MTWVSPGDTASIETNHQITKANGRCTSTFTNYSYLQIKVISFCAMSLPLLTKFFKLIEYTWLLEHLTVSFTIALFDIWKSIAISFNFYCVFNQLHYFGTVMKVLSWKSSSESKKTLPTTWECFDYVLLTFR